MKNYTAYGLGICSSFDLPELVTIQKTRPADVIVQQGPVDFARRPQGAEGSNWIWATRGEACLFIQTIGGIHVQGGKTITVDMVPGAEEALMRIYLLGPALYLLLHQRGYLLLHASCVELPEGAAAFVANKGTGKSTLAAAFVRRGFPIVADDLIAVEINVNGQPIVHPGFPQMKLLPDALEGLGEDPKALPKINSVADKHARRAEKFSDRPVPLRRVYVLAEGGQRQGIEPLSGHAAFMALCEHSYVLPLLRATGALAHHFQQAITLASQGAVKKILRRREHSALDELIDLVRADVGEKQTV